MQHIKLNGSYFQMGKQFGLHARRKIKLMSEMTYYLMSLYNSPGAKPFKPNYWYLPSVVANGRHNKRKWNQWAKEYIPLIEKYNPNAIEFMKGVADGAKVSFEQILFLNISTEALRTCSIWGANGASSKRGEPLIGMNADEVKSTQGFECFVDVNPEYGYRYKGTAMYGWFLCNHGMNEHGLAVASTLLFLSSSAKSAGPPFMVYQKLLSQCKNVAEARIVFDEIPEMNTGAVFYLADHDNLLKVECSREGKEYLVVNHGHTYNTNFATLGKIVGNDAAPRMKDNENMNARYRSDRMKTLLAEYNGNINYESMITIARDHGVKGEGNHHNSICQHPRIMRYNTKTLVSFIAQPRENRFWYSEGNPCENTMEEVRV